MYFVDLKHNDPGERSDFELAVIIASYSTRSYQLLRSKK